MTVMRMVLLCGLALLSLPAGAGAACRQALALGLDVSGSVDAREYRLQRDGLAAALEAPPVRAALLALPGHPVQIAVYEWSGSEDQAVILPWTEITDATALERAVARLRETARRDSTPGTALGTAMRFGAALLAQRPDCVRHTLDISGDGISNFGPRPRDVRQALQARDLTINALVIGADDPAGGDSRQAEIGGLASYFRAEVILGPDAFVQTAVGFEDYGRAMTAKLLRELDGMVFSALRAPLPDQ